MLEDGMLYITHKPKIESKLEGEIGVSIEELLDKLRLKRLKDGTIHSYKAKLQSFMCYLQQKSVVKLEQIQENDVIKYIEVYKSDKSHLVTSLKAYFDFIEERYGFNSSISDSLRQLKISKPEPLPFVFNKEDIATIERSVLRESPMGKRDYAMILLASRFGLRISDIANLKFDNIDWDKNVISIVQEKTGHRLELPLLIEVGNAIVDYLKYGRPSIESRYIFISAKAPYRPVTTNGISDVIRKIITNSGVSSRTKRVGAHSLRFSLATTLIKEGSTLPMVSQILGHTATDSTRTYIRVDVDSLRQCCLDVPKVPSSHYDSKKGVYYE
jgi:site-specific recombinase XerD